MNDNASKEQRDHSSGYKPFSYYNCDIPGFFSGVPLHWHPEFELNFIREGSAVFICGDDKFTAAAGDIVVFLPDMLHSVSRDGNSRCAYDTLVFGEAMLGAQDTDRSAAEYIRPMSGKCGIHSRISADHPYHAELRTCAEQIFSCAKGDSPMLDLLLKSELMRFFWLLLESGYIFPLKEADSGNAEIIRPAIQYINQNYAEHITIDMLANISHLSRSYFMGCFRRAAGTGAMEYVNQVRTRAAVRLIETTKLGISEIAYECGFRNLSNFNRQFRDITGVTPSEYRKKGRNTN